MEVYLLVNLNHPNLKSHTVLGTFKSKENVREYLKSSAGSESIDRLFSELVEYGKTITDGGTHLELKTQMVHYNPSNNTVSISAVIGVSPYRESSLTVDGIFRCAETLNQILYKDA